MDLKSAGLCLILAIIIENADGRHLSGEGFGPVSGRQGIPSPWSRSDFRSSIPGIRQTRFSPLHRSRRLARFQGLGITAGASRLSSPFQPQLGDRRVSLRPLGTRSGLNSLERGSLGSVSTGINPIGSSSRLLRIPSRAGPRRMPFNYYRPSNLQPRTLPRGLTVSRDLTSRLRQRFGTIYGSGTRDDPIRIPAIFSSHLATSQRGSRPLLRQSIRQPVQRASRQQGRRNPVTRARQQSQTSRQEVLALIGFDQAASRLPVLSETIDKQVQVQRTLITKTALPKSKSVSTSSKITETKTTGKSTGTDGSRRKHVDIQQLKKVDEKTVSAIRDSKSTEVLQETKHSIRSVADGLLHSEIKQASEQIGARKQSTEVSKGELPIKTLATDFSTSTKTSVTANNKTLSAATDADTGVITKSTTHVDYSSEISTASNLSVEKAITSETTASGMVIPVEKAASTETIAQAEPATEVTAFGEPASEVLVSAESALSSELDPAASELNAENFLLVDSASDVVQAEAALPSEVVVPVVSVPTSKNVVPGETASELKTLVPVELVPASESPKRETVVLPETVPVTETVVLAETSPVTETVVLGETVPSSETILAETAPVTETAVLRETDPSSETVVLAETIPVKETVVLAEPDPTTETIVLVETGPVKETVVLGETAPTLENAILAEATPAETVLVPEVSQASEIIVPAETSSTQGISIPLEQIPASENIVLTEATPASEIVAFTETAPVSESVVLTEAAPSSVVLTEAAQTSKTVVLTETAPSSETVVLTEATPASETVLVAGASLASEIIVPAETSSIEGISIPLEPIPASENVVLEELTQASENVVLAETAPASETIVLAEAIPLPEKIITVEQSPSSDNAVPLEPATSVVIPVETAPVETFESAVIVESTPAPKSVVPVETSVITETVVPAENTVVTENVVPVETVFPTEILVLLETVPYHDPIIPADNTLHGVIDHGSHTVAKTEMIPEVIPGAQKEITSVNAVPETQLNNVETVSKTKQISTNSAILSKDVSLELSKSDINNAVSNETKL